MNSLLLRLALLALSLAPLATSSAQDSGDSAKRWAQYEPEFKAFAEADRAKPPVPGGILFVGSSIFRRWTNLTEQMAPLPVLNRAFGGSRTGDQLARFAQLIPPYAPKVIVYYCGSNDINADEMPAVIVANFRAFAERVHASFPPTRVVFASIIRAPQKMERWDRVDAANALIRDFCAKDPRLLFIDVNPAVFDIAGKPRMDLYLDDKLHYLPPAYVEFTAIIKPVLTRVWAAAQ